MLKYVEFMNQILFRVMSHSAAKVRNLLLSVLRQCNLSY